MQFDTRTLTRIGMAVVVIVAAALWQWLSPGEEVAPPNAVAPAPPIVAESERETAPTERAAMASAPAAAEELPAPHGDFDYYVLVLSWSPTFCSSDAGQGREDDLQCRSGRPYGFVLHGLWPQYERGYPQSCDSDEPRYVSGANMRRALDVSPSDKLVQHEWEKHGTCAGLSQDDYFSTAIKAFTAVAVPREYKLPKAPLETTPDEVREAFLKDNPTLTPDEVSATCSRNELSEIWVCLEKNLTPRACSNDVAKRHCGSRHVRMRAVRGDWP